MTTIINLVFPVLFHVFQCTYFKTRSCSKESILLFLWLYITDIFFFYSQILLLWKMKLQMAYDYHEKNSELGKDKSSSPIHRIKEWWGDINDLWMYVYDFSKSENRYFSYSFKLKVFQCAQYFNIWIYSIY